VNTMCLSRETTVSWFSAGVSSAVATRPAIDEVDREGLQFSHLHHPLGVEWTFVRCACCGWSGVAEAVYCNGCGHFLIAATRNPLRPLTSMKSSSATGRLTGRG